VTPIAGLPSLGHQSSSHGLIRASFVPPTPVQEMRDLTRTRKQLVREVAQHTQRIQKTLEDANVKLTGHD
jgi:transposase